jgi:hypothetical protein
VNFSGESRTIKMSVDSKRPSGTPSTLFVHQESFLELEQSDALLTRALAAQSEQAQLVDVDATLESRYNAALAAQVEAVHDQIATLEDRLEVAISLYSTKLRTTQTHPPGFFSKAVTRSGWQDQIQRQQCTVFRMQNRLEQIRDIKDGMGFLVPRIQEIAESRLRAKSPELVRLWDELQVADRMHQNMLRKQILEKAESTSDRQASRIGTSLTRMITLGT